MIIRYSWCQWPDGGIWELLVDNLNTGLVHFWHKLWDCIRLCCISCSKRLDDVIWNTCQNHRRMDFLRLTRTWVQIIVSLHCIWKVILYIIFWMHRMISRLWGLNVQISTTFRSERPISPTHRYSIVHIQRMKKTNKLQHLPFKHD